MKMEYFTKYIFKIIINYHYFSTEKYLDIHIEYEIMIHKLRTIELDNI